jgi:hypothetical protein
MSLLDDVSIVVTPNGYKAGELYAVVPTYAEGVELINLSSFVSATNWAINGSEIEASGTTALFKQPFTLGAGKTFKITIVVDSITSGNFEFWVGGYSNDTPTISIADTYTYYVTSGGSELYMGFNPHSNLIAIISSVSVKEVTSADMDVTRETAATRVDEDGLVNYAEVIGSDLANDGDFLLTGTQPENTTGTYWNTGASWSIASGVASCDGTQTSGTYLGQTGLTFTNAKTYKVTYTVTVSAGNISARLQGSGATVTGTSKTSNGTYTDYLVSTGNTSFRMRGNTDFVGTVTNISVKEVTRDNVPRIDYTGGGCPHILSEPQRTNLYPYSEDFSSWDNQNTTISSNLVTSPDGTENASEILETTTNGNHGRYYTFHSVSGGTDYSVSMFVKKLNRRYFGLQSWYGATRGAIAFFDLDTGTLLYEFAEYTGYSVSSSKIEDYGNGWYKISTIFQIPSGAHFYAGFVLADSEWTTGTSYDNAYTGDATKGAYIWGAQFEEGSYATSYIPNFGTSAGVTRNQDIFTRDGIGSLINSTEGVLFFEGSILSDDGTTQIISLFESASSRVSLTFSSTLNRIQFYVAINGYTNTVTINAEGFTKTEVNKIALRYGANNYALFINGVKEGENTTQGNTFTVGSLTELTLSNTLPFYGKVKQLQVYNTALTDEQLLQLTGTSGTDFYESYAEMASALTYTIQ